MESIPGDPTVLRATGEGYRDTAEAIRAAVATLETIARPGAMVSLAIDRVRSDAARVAHDIAAAERRYAETGEALVDFAVALAAAQEEAESAIRDAEAAAEAERAASIRESTLQDRLAELDDADGTESSMLERAIRVAAAELVDVAAAGSAAAARYVDAVAERDRAARAAIERIRDVVEGSGLNDRFWDDVAGALRGAAEFLARAADAMIDLLTAAVAFVVELVVTVLVVIAAVLVLGLAILALILAAVVTIALVAVLLAAAFVLVVLGALFAAGLIAVGFAVVAVLLARVLAGLLVFLSGTALLTLANLVRGMDPVEALTQAAIASLLVSFPELQVVIRAASNEEAGTPVFEGATPVGPPAEYTFGTMFDDLIAIDAAGHLDPEHPEVNDRSVVRIIPFEGPDGATVYRVHIPSTQQWTPGGTSGNDVTSDLVAKMDQEQRTQLEKMVVDAMERAGVEPGAHVMLAGWSLGGITAGNLASDPEFSSTYRVTAIAVAGASVDDLDIPLQTKVLDVSHSTDPVPRTENPFASDHSGDPNRYRIDVAPPGGADQLGHVSTKYQQTMETLVDEGGSEAGVRFTADDPDAAGGVQVSDYFGTPALDAEGDELGASDYAYTRGD
ncbi:hypothetical protein [Agromyces bauzanensis]